MKAWVTERAPLLHHCLSTFMHTRCFLYGDARSKGVDGRCRVAGVAVGEAKGYGISAAACVCAAVTVLEYCERAHDGWWASCGMHAGLCI